MSRMKQFCIAVSLPSICCTDCGKLTKVEFRFNIWAQDTKAARNKAEKYLRNEMKSRWVAFPNPPTFSDDTNE